MLRELLGMLDFNIAGPIIGILAIVDIVIHLHLDFKKVATNKTSHFSEPSSQIPTTVMAIVSIATLLSFILVGIIPLVWMFNASEPFLVLLGTVYSPELAIWLTGLILLVAGILLHIWSRVVRQEMAASWAMRKEHVLVTNGPYSRIRNPSYSSYFMCFVGLIIMLPSVITLILLIGIPGYYRVALIEEEHLQSHFGDAYEDYRNRSGRFFPRLIR